MARKGFEPLTCGLGSAEENRNDKVYSDSTPENVATENKKKFSAIGMTGKGAAKRARTSSSASVDLALYDGTRYIGRIVGRKADGFAARTPKGKRLGSFASIREAAAGLSAHAAAGGR